MFIVAASYVQLARTKFRIASEPSFVDAYNLRSG